MSSRAQLRSLETRGLTMLSKSVKITAEFLQSFSFRAGETQWPLTVRALDGQSQ